MPDIPVNTASLKRGLSLPLIIFYGIGNILGAGIYVLIGKVGGYAGYLLPVSFLCAALVAGLTAFTYSELSARYPLSAGAAIYVKHGLGSRYLSLGIGLLIITTGIVSAAAIARGVVGYFDIFLPLPDWLVICLLVGILGALAAWGIMESIRTAALFTLIEIGGLVLIIVIGIPYLQFLPEKFDYFVPSLEMADWKGITLGAFLAFYAFVGFEDMVNVAEEVKDVRKNLPLAILISLFTTSALYIAVSIVALLILKPDELAGSDAPLAMLFTRVSGESPYMISAISVFAVVNGALIQIIMVSRMCYGLSRQKLLPASLATVHPRTRTPLYATVAVTAIVIMMAVAFPVEALARTTSYCLLISFTLVNLSLFRIKLREPAAENLFTVPIWIPAAGFVSCVLLLIFQIVSST